MTGRHAYTAGQYAREVRARALTAVHTSFLRRDLWWALLPALLVFLA